MNKPFETVIILLLWGSILVGKILLLPAWTSASIVGVAAISVPDTKVAGSYILSPGSFRANAGDSSNKSLNPSLRP